MAQHYGVEALATSSASLAWANGYSDGGALPRSVFFDAILRIVRVCRVPLSVDIEDGYSHSPSEVADLVERLVNLGVVGINIEDGDQAPELLIDKVLAIRERLGDQTPFINARTDVYLAQPARAAVCYEETLNRANAYEKAGVDGVFVPGPISCDEVSRLVSSIQLPINVMLNANTLTYADWLDAGVKRISYGPSPFIAAYSIMAKLVSEARTQSSQFPNSRPNNEDASAAVDYRMLNTLFSKS